MSLGERLEKDKGRTEANVAKELFHKVIETGKRIKVQGHIRPQKPP